jgi:hypothetical protein
MPTVHLTLTDTPTGGVSAHTSFKPALGQNTSNAQAEALDALRGIQKRWGKEPAESGPGTALSCSPLLYLAGPMTDLPEFNHPAFHTAAAQLRAAGYTVANPAENGIDRNESWLVHMRRDIIDMMTHCNAVATLPGWQNSRGAKAEIALAAALGMPVQSIDEWLRGRRLFAAWAATRAAA